MAKEIYVDGNGNEQLVSGTINNAEMLPIESGSATDTKSYIDSKTNTLNGTFTPSTNVSVLRSTLKRVNEIKILSVIFQITGAVSDFGTLSANYGALNNYDFTATSDDGKVMRLRIQANSNTITFSSTSDLNKYFAFTIAFI